jgi:hypothetical protein
MSKKNKVNGQTANMDEMPLTFIVLSRRTVASKDGKTISIKTNGHEKAHYRIT